MSAVIKVGIYLRISRDPEGRELGVERQKEDCLRKAKSLGWRVVDVYSDNDISASTLSTKPRPQYDRMIEDVESGRIEAILSYSNSRLTRRPAQWIDLINLVKKTGVKIETCVSGTANLGTADGRAVAITIAAWDAAEAERIQERVLRKHAELRTTGAMVGRRTFGWALDDAGRLTGNLVPEEAALIRDGAQMLLRGLGLSKVAETWNAAGVTSTRGAAWDHRNLRTLYKNAKLAGFRVHRNQIVRDDAGNPVMGQWTPILDPETWVAVRRVIDAKKSTRNGKPIHPLTASVWCECGGIMHGMTAREKSGAVRYNYVCSVCRGGIAQKKLHPLVWRAAAESVIYGPEGDQRTPDVSAGLHGRLTALQTAKANLLDLVTSHGWNPSDITTKRAALDKEIEEVEEALNTLAAQNTTDSVLWDLRRALWAPGTTFEDAARIRSEMTERIAELPMEQQRTLVRGSLRVTVNRVGKGNVKTERVQIKHLIATQLNSENAEMEIAG